MRAIGRLGPVTPLLATAESELAPDPIDSLAAVMASTLTKLNVQPWGAVSATTLLVNFTNLLGKLSILLGSRAGVGRPLAPLIIPTAAHAKGLAEHLNGISLLHFFDPFVALEGPSQTIPSVFF
jgi:hypothetical protein